MNKLKLVAQWWNLDTEPLCTEKQALWVGIQEMCTGVTEYGKSGLRMTSLTECEHFFNLGLIALHKSCSSEQSVTTILSGRLQLEHRYFTSMLTSVSYSVP